MDAHFLFFVRPLFLSQLKLSSWFRLLAQQVFLLFFLCFSCFVDAEEKGANKMTQAELHRLIEKYADKVKIDGSVVQFSFKGVDLVCVSDATADRMRIISPITTLENIDTQQLVIAMAANFHSLLDARYAISDGLVYAAFIHPLGSLSRQDLESAIRQVAQAKLTFGTEYSSGELFFPGSDSPSNTDSGESDNSI